MLVGGFMQIPVPVSRSSGAQCHHCPMDPLGCEGDERARVSAIIEGLEVSLQIEGRLVTAYLSRKALERRWDAKRGGRPEDWLAAYEQHRTEIHAFIVTRYALRERAPVIVRVPE